MISFIAWFILGFVSVVVVLCLYVAVSVAFEKLLDHDVVGFSADTGKVDKRELNILLGCVAFVAVGIGVVLIIL